jgi:gamma-glutamyl:cysteine ligase YbdK (ATP-grasp superfamily)
MTSDVCSFKQMFGFEGNQFGTVGSELEFFIYSQLLKETDGGSGFVSGADELLPALRFSSIGGPDSFTYELSNCQIEYRTGVHSTSESLIEEVKAVFSDFPQLFQEYDYQPRFIPVGPEDMPLDVYPHDARYKELEEKLPEDILRAACRVAGIHVHIGTENFGQMLKVYNAFVKHYDVLVAFINPGNTERLDLYRQVADFAGQVTIPPYLESMEHFYALAVKHGFTSNLKDCWWLIRPTRFGTVELRFPDMTEDLGLLEKFITMCLEIAHEAAK